MNDAFDTTDPIPAQHCPNNEMRYHWLIRYHGSRGGPVELLYTGPNKTDATREIARLEAEGNRVIPPAISWSDPDAPCCEWCEHPFGEDREGGEVELCGTAHPVRWAEDTYEIRRAKRPRGPGQQRAVSTRLEICQQCADEMQANRENAVRRLQAGGLARKDAEAIHGGDAQALRRAMEERGVPAMRPLRRDGTMSDRADNLYREAAIAGILGDKKEAESKRNDARAEEFYLDRQRAIHRIEQLGINRGCAEEVVDELLLQMKSGWILERSDVESARERTELMWSIAGLVLIPLAIGFGIFYGLG